ncbi:hypothetical protein QZH41_013167 [Actinostola sp. cb2023]|nr:hypothetical protein QZH41_013167 [Actinostola sp. cb2023]
MNGNVEEVLQNGPTTTPSGEEDDSPERILVSGASGFIACHVVKQLLDSGRAMKNCSYVIHMASPFPVSNPRDESEIIEPAVEGTINVLEACSKANIKRVVLTSSIAAVHSSAEHASKAEVTEENWSVEEQCGAYAKSKLMAERAAWEFVKKLPGNRYLAVTGGMWIKDTAKILYDEFKPQGNCNI